MNTLLVEAGSTKSDWVVFSEGIVNEEFTSVGINPSTQSRSAVLAGFQLAIQQINSKNLKKVFYYGAGCKGLASTLVEEILHHLLPNSEIHVYSDLLAAARSSCQGSEGIVAILGTGSHSCFSDGHEIVEGRPSLGYLLGDEGSGNAYGKKILRTYFYGELDKDLKMDFELTYPFVREQYLSRLYSSSQMAAELAQFFPYLIKHKNNPEIKAILNEGIQEFYFSRVVQYKELFSYPIHLVGSVALALKEEYNHLFSEAGIIKVIFNPKPMNGLLKYHLQYADNS